MLVQAAITCRRHQPCLCADGQLVAWNMSNIIANNFITQFYTPPGTVLTANWPEGIMWTRPLPTSLISGTTSVLGSPSVFGISADQSTIVLKTVNQYWGFSAKDGTSLWNLTLNYPVSQNEEMTLYGVSDFIILDPVASTFKCYSCLLALCYGQVPVSQVLHGLQHGRFTWLRPMTTITSMLCSLTARWQLTVWQRDS